MHLLEKFIHYIKNENLFQPQDQLLLAVSGGVDSVVLCDLCKKAGFGFSIAHCNFSLRAAESDSDELFVKGLGEKYQVEVYVKKFDTEAFAHENKLSIQVAARDLRYSWFRNIINISTAKPYDFLLTAQHANDNIETLLMNFLKGTGIAGLQGILPKSGSVQKIIRPLLFAKKEALLAYAKENDLSYREDSSNATDAYSRNYLRNNVLPLLKEIYPQVEDNLADNIKRFNELNILYHQSLSALKKKLVIEKNGEYHLPVLKLQKTAALATILFELTKDIGFSPGQVRDIIGLLKADSGKYVDSPSHRILKNRKWLIISKKEDDQQAHFLIEAHDGKIHFANRLLTIEKKDSLQKISDDPHIAQLDAHGIKFPLLLRKWKQGDYFYPLGMQKKKKLSRFFVDQKLSLFEKENSWVIESDRKIIWVVGRRIDNRFKVSPTSSRIYILKLDPDPGPSSPK